MKNRIPHVALVVEDVYAQHQTVLRGILRFSKAHGPWAINIIRGRKGDADLAKLRKWGCDGIVASRIDAALARFAHRRGIPALQISVVDPPKHSDVSIVCDDETIGRMAADHFLQRGFANFAFVGDLGRSDWSKAREASFRSALKRRRFGCSVFADSRDDGLARFLQGLPKPVAVFAAFDLRAREVLDACVEAGLRVPNDVAILGVDNEEMICETSSPTLSSIPLSNENAGFQAAEALSRIMSGERPKRPVRIRFSGERVIERESTRRLKKNDWLVERCLEIIAANTNLALTTADLVQGLKVSRRTLEVRFKEATGLTLARASVLARLNRARVLFAETAKTQDEVAASCGFCNASHLNRLFRQHFGAPPTAFRHVK